VVQQGPDALRSTMCFLASELGLAYQVAQLAEWGYLVWNKLTEQEAWMVMARGCSIAPMLPTNPGVML
jgi:hypothetical protein